jgi:invasion protein IalB
MKYFWKNIVVAGILNIAATVALAQSPAENNANISEINYQDWTVRCGQVEGTGRSCVMAQLVQLEESGEWLMQVNIAYIPEREEPVMSIVLPLGVGLQGGVKFQLGDADENTNVMGYSHCIQDGCYVNQLLSDEAIQRITDVESGSVTFVTLLGEAIDVPFSPQGFVEALAALRE